MIETTGDTRDPVCAEHLALLDRVEVDADWHSAELAVSRCPRCYCRRVVAAACNRLRVSGPRATVAFLERAARVSLPEGPAVSG